MREDNETGNASVGKASTGKLPQRLLLYGPHGTGKISQAIDYCLMITGTEFSEEDRAEKLRQLQDAGRVVFIVPHAGWEEGGFLERQSRKTGSPVEDGELKKICVQAGQAQKEARAKGTAAPNYVFVINCERARYFWELGDVLKSLAVLLRGQRRGRSRRIRLPYTRDNFRIPSNVHIIIIMDGSSGYDDDNIYYIREYPLLRHFYSRKTSIDYSGLHDIDGTDAAEILRVLNERIDRYAELPDLLSQKYFAGAETAEDLIYSIKHKIYPNLVYSHNDEFMISQMLGGCQTVQEWEEENGDFFMVRKGSHGIDFKLADHPNRNALNNIITGSGEAGDRYGW